MTNADSVEVPSRALEMFVRAFEVQNAYGQAKYGTVLRTHNDRDFGKDLLQELADAVNYAGGFVLEHNDALQTIEALKSEVDELLFQLGRPIKYGGAIG